MNSTMRIQSDTDIQGDSHKNTTQAMSKVESQGSALSGVAIFESGIGQNQQQNTFTTFQKRKNTMAPPLPDTSFIKTEKDSE